MGKRLQTIGNFIYNPNKRDFIDYKREIIYKWLPLIFTIISGIFFGLNYLFYDKANKELTNSRLKIENDLRLREFENGIKLTLYKEVKDAIVQKDTVIQNATLLVVNEMLDTDSTFRNKLINILLQSTNSKGLIQTQQNLDKFKEEQNINNPENFTIDVFYLEDIMKEAEPIAEKVCVLLRSKYPQQYIIRKRLLPKSINARIGYQIYFNQIRYDNNTDEETIAKDILMAIQKSKIFYKEQPKLKNINNKTNNYLSIFICNL